jgi:hypothetical protein
MGLLILTALLAATPSAQVQTLDGDSVAGQLVRLANESVVLETAEGPREFATKQLAGMSFSMSAPAAPGAPAAEQPAAWVTLADGSLLLAKTYTASDSQARLALVGGGNIEIPTRAIDNVRFREHAGPLADQWAEIVKSDRSTDSLVVRKNDALDFLSGILRDVADDIVKFELDGDTLRVKRSKVDGLLYNDSGRPAAGISHGVVTDAAGSRLRAESLELDGDMLRLRTTGGVTLARPLAGLARIDFSPSNVKYLGDLEPESSHWTPYLGDANVSPAAAEFFRARADRSPDGGPLRVGGKDYAKGLTLHSRTEISYRLPEKFHLFRAVLGIDDRLRPGGNLRLVILGDERTLFEQTLSGKDAPRPVELDITGINRLKFLVDFGDDMDVGDWLDLCEARMLK